MAKKGFGRTNANGPVLGFEQTLWQTAGKLRKNIGTAEYKHISLGLIFLKYISDSFEALCRYNLSRWHYALLPKLMRGEIRVKTTDKIAKETH